MMVFDLRGHQNVVVLFPQLSLLLLLHSRHNGDDNDGDGRHDGDGVDGGDDGDDDSGGVVMMMR